MNNDADLIKSDLKWSIHLALRRTINSVHTFVNCQCQKKCSINQTIF
jgi:hypothetical protein